MSSPEIITLPSAAPTATLSDTILNDILAGLVKNPHSRTLPTILLYDEAGLILYDKITTDVPQYYLFAAEESILKGKSDEIVTKMCGTQRVDGEVVLELGAGSLRKTSHLLKSLAGLVTSGSKPITYLALDLEPRELVKTLTPFASCSDLGAQLAGKVTVKGLCGTYNAGIKFVRDGRLADLMQSEHGNKGRDTVPDLKNIISPLQSLDSPASASTPISSRGSPAMTPSTAPSSLPPSSPPSYALERPPLHFLFLGSSIGNFSREGAAEFLRSLPLRPSTPEHFPDTILLGLDHENPGPLIELAYNDPQGISRDFIMNGLTGANRALGREVFRNDKWEFVGKYNEVESRHEGYYRSTDDQEIEISTGGTTQKFNFEKDELVNIEYSYKYSDKDALALFASSDLSVLQRWISENGMYSVWLLYRPASSQDIVATITQGLEQAVIS